MDIRHLFGLRPSLRTALLSVVLMCGTSHDVRAFEPTVTDHSFNAWGFVNVRYNLTQRWNVTGLAFVRGANGLSEWQQWYVRPSIGYALNRNVEVGVGYTFAQMFPYGSQPVAMAFSEHNIFEQVILRQKAGRVGLMHRFRLEQRFIDRVVQQQEEDARIEGRNYANRFRFRIDGQIPVALKQRLFVGLYNELFVHLQDAMLPDAFDQNRVYVGLGYQFNDRLRLEMGMLHQYIRKRNGVRFESNPTMQLGLGFQFGPIRRKAPEIDDRREI